MKPIVVIVHAEHEGPGYLTTVLHRHGIPIHPVSIVRNDPIPEHARDICGLVSMGGPMSVNDPLPWVEAECRLIRACFEAGVPVLGHCLGGQMMSKALGGTISRNPVREIGWHDVQQADCLESREWMPELPQRFPVFHWHGETFSLPAGATRILGNANCTDQGFVLGNSLALQCHIEMTEALVRDWVERSPEEFKAPRGAVQSAAEIVRDLTARVKELNKIAEAMYEVWLRGLKQ